MDGIPVMMMSSLQNDEVINLSMSLGAADYILKPVDFFLNCCPKISRLES